MKRESNDHIEKNAPQSPLAISGLNRDERRSAFTPYRPSTVLTNLQRGNVKTETPICLPERTMHQLAAQGELFSTFFTPDKLCKIDETDDNGYTALHWAAAYGQLTTVRLLLEKGANARIKGNHGETCLHFAASNGHLHVLKELLASEENNNFLLNETDEDGNTALMFASYANHALCVNELLKSGVDITLQNVNLDTAYSIAVNKKNKS
ncbi:ankyrin repeat family A protein 2-like protein, partial [Leptotrombidium deliense]